MVIVIMHWGTEGQACPDANQLALAPKLARAGANIIVGSHAHILQGSGWLGRTFVAYGMANFLWWEASYSTSTGRAAADPAPARAAQRPFRASDGLRDRAARRRHRPGRPPGPSALPQPARLHPAVGSSGPVACWAGSCRARGPPRSGAAGTSRFACRSGCSYSRGTDAGWSSSVARWAHNPEVAGSNPAPATKPQVEGWFRRRNQPSVCRRCVLTRVRAACPAGASRPRLTLCI